MLSQKLFSKNEKSTAHHHPLCCSFPHSFPSALLSALLLFLLLPMLAGCDKNRLPEKTKDLDFTVVAGTDIPVQKERRFHRQIVLMADSGYYSSLWSNYRHQKK